MYELIRQSAAQAGTGTNDEVRGAAGCMEGCNLHGGLEARDFVRELHRKTSPAP